MIIFRFALVTTFVILMASIEHVRASRSPPFEYDERAPPALFLSALPRNVAAIHIIPYLSWECCSDLLLVSKATWLCMEPWRQNRDATLKHIMKKTVSVPYYEHARVLLCDAPSYPSAEEFYIANFFHMPLTSGPYLTLKKGNKAKQVRLDFTPPYFEQICCPHVYNILPNEHMLNSILKKMRLAIKLTSKESMDAPHFISRLTNLRRLRLNFTHNIKGIPHSYEQLKKLKCLAIRISSSEALDLSNLTTLWRLRHISHLDLRLNRICHIPEQIGQLLHLRKLNLTYNEIEELPQSLVLLTNLTVLNLTKNKLLKLPDNLADMSGLKILKLSHNKLTTLPKGLNKSGHLEMIDLRHNPIIKFPKSVTKSRGKLKL